MTNSKFYNTASLWGNTGSLEHGKQPIFRGTVNVDGVNKDVSLWLSNFFTDDAEIITELQDCFEDILAIVEEVGGTSPLLTGKINEPYKKGGDAAPAAKASRRTPRAGRSADAPKADAPEADAPKDGYTHNGGYW